MFVENGKISNRQTKRLFVFDLMGMATLLLPPYLARLCGTGGVFSIIAGTAFSILYLLYLGWIMKHLQMDLYQFLEFHTRPLPRGFTYVFILFHCLLTAGFCGYVFTNLMQYSLVTKIPFWMILLLIMVVSAYAVSGGIESRARVYEVLFLFVLLPYIGMMLASVKNVEMVYLEEFFRLKINQFWKGSFLVFLFFTPLFFSLFLIGEKNKNYGRNVIKTIFSSICVAAGILLGSYLLLLGNFGEASLASMKYPVVTLMSTIQFKGNFLKRMDALMLAVWFFTLYALLNLHLHYATAMMQAVFSKRKKKKWQVVLASLLVFGLGYSIQGNENLIWLFVDYYSYVAVPFMILWPGILLLCKKK